MSENFSTQTSLSDLSYYKTGGNCQFLYAPKSETELSQNLNEIIHQGKQYFLLGGGSNSLVSDEYWDGAVISFHQLDNITIDNTVITAQAGVTNNQLVSTAHQYELSGVEWMYYLPGQVGGSVRMNARCYGGETSQVVKEVRCMDLKGEIHTFENNKENSIFRGYKDTYFMDHELIVVAVCFSLNKGESKKIKDKMVACKTDREKKGQFTFPSCGCIFKNNYAPEVSVPSGMLLQKSGVKGLKHKGAVVSNQHANFVFNQGASSRSILELTFVMREKVWEKFGVWLEYEMEFLGSIPDDLKHKFSEYRPPHYNYDLLKQARSEFISR